MPIGTTLTNYRESNLPYFGSKNDGTPGLLRQYEASIQALIEGDTLSVLQQAQVYTEMGEIYTSLGQIPDIPVDDNNNFVPQVDLNPPDPDNLIISLSEVQGQYNKGEYGKMSLMVSIDIKGPKQFLDSATLTWTNVSPAEY